MMNYYSKKSGRVQIIVREELGIIKRSPVKKIIRSHELYDKYTSKHLEGKSFEI